jgi:translation initiation factor 5B
MLNKLKMALEKQKEEEERLQREAEEEERRLREEERLAEEQRKYEEELRRAEKEAAKEAEKEDKKDRKKIDAQLHLERMRAAGFILPDVEKLKQEAKPAPKQVPKPAPKKHQDPVPHAPVVVIRDAPTAVQTASSKEQPKKSNAASVEEVQKPTEEDDLEDDWEAQMEKEEQAEAARVAKEAEEKERQVAERVAADEARRAEHVLEKVSSLRSPICCVLGHVDTGKTSLLDRIRSTNVQGGEAGGITQQIGATFFPKEALVAATEELNKKYKHELNVPGLLVIDTPGHESFTNLRSRGSSLCDIAILVVDIMHGLEPQTKESLRLLRDRKCPFIVALNKVDRLYEWVPHENMDIEQSLALQKEYVRTEFETRTANILTEFSEQGFNAQIYFRNKDIKRYVSIVPTSAKTGEGICDLLLLKIQLVQQFMEGKVTYKDDLQCTVLEVKPIQGVGFTIDVVLINGILHEGDNIVVCGANGPIYTQIRALLTPQPMKELRVRGDYVHHKEIRAAMGIKIAANDLEFAVPGTQLKVVRDGDDREKLAAEIMKDQNKLLQDVDKSGVGVSVQSSTLGSLEALLQFLKDMKIPVSSINIGPIHKRHMLHVVAMKRKAPRYAVMLAFDVDVTPEAQEIADKSDIDIFSARIIYHLFDMFTRYHTEYDARVKDKARLKAVFPVRLKILQAIRNTDPIILGVTIVRGSLHVNTPLAFLKPGPTGAVPVTIGKVMAMERDGKEVKLGKTGMDLAVKINSSETGVTFGRQFDETNELLSVVTRESVDALKLLKDETTQDDAKFLAKLMEVFHVPKNKKKPAAADGSKEEGADDEDGPDDAPS